MHGVSINPIAFLVVQESGVKLLPVNYASAVDKLLDYVPDIIEKANDIANKMMNETKKEEHEYQIPKPKEMKKREKNDPEDKIIKQRPKRANKNSILKQQPSTDTNVSTEYEYDETTDSNMEDIPNYTDYNEEYDD